MPNRAHDGARRGRPPKPDADRRRDRKIGLSDTEYAEVDALAREAGLARSVYMRRRVLQKRVRRPDLVLEVSDIAQGLQRVANALLAKHSDPGSALTTQQAVERLSKLIESL